jgi:uncharacterized NAD(P)/FAD-binding protein YdhS
VIQIGQEDECEGSLPTVAIVGGGVSGTMVAIQLLRTARGPLRVKVIEPREQLGRGIAYSSPSPAHLLNVPASNMSALPDEPGHFLSWMRQCRDPDTSGYSFVSRATYGEYVEQLLREAELGGDSDISVMHIRERALSITPIENGFDVWLEKAPPLRAHLIILALGNGPAANPFAAPVEAEIVNAWSTTALDQLSRDAPVLLAGSGLTAIDICLSLIEIDHAGPVYIVSRHGLLPRVHLEAPATARPTVSEPNPRSQSAGYLMRSEVSLHERSLLAGAGIRSRTRFDHTSTRFGGVFLRTRNAASFATCVPTGRFIAIGCRCRCITR